MSDVLWFTQADELQSKFQATRARQDILSLLREQSGMHEVRIAQATRRVLKLSTLPKKGNVAVLIPKLRSLKTFWRMGSDWSRVLNQVEL